MRIDTHYHLAQDRAEWPKALKISRLNGVSFHVVSCVRGTEEYPTAEQIRGYNQESYDFVKLAGKDAACWLAYLNPQLPNWDSELKTCLDAGAVGIKIWTAFKDERGRFDNCYPVLQAAGKRGLPILMHTGNSADSPSPGAIDAEEFAFLANRFPQTTVVGAHAGANWRQGVNPIRSCGPNACIDLCGTDPDRGMLETLVGAVGPDRVLFGSDMPGRSQASQLAKVVFADVDDAVKEKVLWKNAARVFKIDLANVKDLDPVEPGPGPIDSTVDYLCFCGRWPFFQLPELTASELDCELALRGVGSAYVADLGSLFRIDLAIANRQFLESAGGCSRVHPLAVVNLRSQDWRRILDRAGEGFAGVIVSPYLHNWRLNDPAFAEFFQSCAKRKTRVWVNTRLHDRRLRYTGAAFREVLKEELVDFAKGAPANRYVFQGVAADAMEAMLALGRRDADFHFDVSKLSDLNGQLARILKAHGAAELVHGSEFPLRHIQSVAWTNRREATLVD